MSLNSTKPDLADSSVKETAAFCGQVLAKQNCNQGSKSWKLLWGSPTTSIQLFSGIRGWIIEFLLHLAWFGLDRFLSIEPLHAGLRKLKRVCRWLLDLRLFWISQCQCQSQHVLATQEQEQLWICTKTSKKIAYMTKGRMMSHASHVIFRFAKPKHIGDCVARGGCSETSSPARIWLLLCWGLTWGWVQLNLYHVYAGMS